MLPRRFAEEARASLPGLSGDVIVPAPPHAASVAVNRHARGCAMTSRCRSGRSSCADLQLSNQPSTFEKRTLPTLQWSLKRSSPAKMGIDR